MGIFKRRKKKVSGLLGVDLGAGGMKVVELRKNGEKSVLGTYGYANYGSEFSRDAALDQPKLGAELLKKILKESKTEVTEAVVSLPSHEVFHSMVTVPVSIKDKAEVNQYVRQQAAKLFKRPLEEMMLDLTLIDKPEKKKQKEELTADEVVEEAIKQESGKVKVRRVLVSAAPKELVQKYVSLFSIAGVQLKALETEAFALIRSLVGKDRSRVMVIDMGYAHTCVTIVQDGIPYLHRTIQVGGNTITERIAASMSIDTEEAEQVKRDLAVGPKTSVPPVLLDAFKPILHEIRFTLELFDQQDFHVYNTVDKIILTGGSAHLPYLDPFLSDALNLNIYLGNPWARVVTPTKLGPALDDIGPRMSVAIGLAMKK